MLRDHVLTSDEIFDLLDGRKSVPCGDDGCTDRLIVITTDQARQVTEFMMTLLETKK